MQLVVTGLEGAVPYGCLVEILKPELKCSISTENSRLEELGMFIKDLSYAHSSVSEGLLFLGQVIYIFKEMF